MTLFSFAGAMLIAASSSAATPLYRLYQQSMHLTPFWITVVFAVYVASLLAALLTVGGLSDYVGTPAGDPCGAAAERRGDDPVRRGAAMSGN